MIAGRNLSKFVLIGALVTGAITQGGVLGEHYLKTSPWPSSNGEGAQAELPDFPVPRVIPSAPRPKGLDSYDEILNRPIFSRTRRPPKGRPIPNQAVVPTTEQYIKTGQYRLLGVLIEEGRPIALVRDARSGETTRVTVGEKIGGWDVVAIHPEALSLKQGTVTDEIMLRDNVLSSTEKRRLNSTRQREKQGGASPPQENDFLRERMKKRRAPSTSRTPSRTRNLPSPPQLRSQPRHEVE